MKIKHNFITNNWSGGKTTELFIFPEGSNYKEKDFNFRLSTATVETESSLFTSLNGVSRKLLVLDGEMTLNHANHHEKTLGKFDVDEFEGDWTTHSIGKCIDFNLMLQNGIKGTVKGVGVEKGRQIEGEIFGSQFFVYVFKGSVELEVGGQIEKLKEKDLCQINSAEIKDIRIKGNTKSEMVLVEIL